MDPVQGALPNSLQSYLPTVRAMGGRAPMGSHVQGSVSVCVHMHRITPAPPSTSRVLCKSPGPLINLR